MTRITLLVAAVAILALVAGPVAAQDAATSAPTPHAAGGFFTVISSGGILATLMWLGIFFWVVAGWPLGILSVVHAATTRSQQVPLATKLLAGGGVWLLLLGWTGVAFSCINAFSEMARSQVDVGYLALFSSQAVYSIAVSHFVCQHYLMFFLISLVILHFRHRAMLRNGQRPGPPSLPSTTSPETVSSR